MNINNTTLCWIPVKQEYLTIYGVKSIGGMIIERELSDSVAERKALFLNNNVVSGYYVAVYQ